MQLGPFDNQDLVRGLEIGEQKSASRVEDCLCFSRGQMGKMRVKASSGRAD